MIKEKVIKVRVCDYCESEDVSTVPCPICGKDMCYSHLKNIEDNYHQCLFICRNHNLSEKEKQDVRDKVGK